MTYSYYSLIPASIPEPLALRLVQYYQTRLEEDLSAHDKIEFEIIFSSYDFMTEEFKEIASLWFYRGRT